MATLQKIRSKGPLLVIILGLALFAFIAEEAMRSIQSATNESRQQVGEVYGEGVSVHEFQDLVDEYLDVVKFTSGNTAVNDEQIAQIRDQVWSAYVNNKLLEKEALELYKQRPDITTISLAYASKERLRNYDNFKNSVNRIFDDIKETYYIPAGRSMITLLVNNRSLIESDNLDLITRQFMQIIDNIHGAFSDGIRNVHKRYPDGERKFDVAKTSEMLISDLKGDIR